MTLKFSTEETVRIMKHVRVAATVRDGLTVDRAYDIAEAIVGRDWHYGREPGRYVNNREEVTPIRARKSEEEKLTPLPGLGAPPCTVHREKVHVFSDGTVWQACSADGCLFGKGTKHHSDGMQSGGLYAIDLPDAIEVEDENLVEEGAEELSVEAWAGVEPTMTEDGDELEPSWQEEQLVAAGAEEDSDGNGE